MNDESLRYLCIHARVLAECALAALGRELLSAPRVAEPPVDEARVLANLDALAASVDFEHFDWNAVGAADGGAVSWTPPVHVGEPGLEPADLQRRLDDAYADDGASRALAARIRRDVTESVLGAFVVPERDDLPALDGALDAGGLGAWLARYRGDDAPLGEAVARLRAWTLSAGGE